MKGSLRAKDGSSVYQLSYPVTTVGREASDIILQFPSVERQHARLTFDDSQGCYVLEDLNSANGTYVNEMRVQNAAVRVAPGDIIRFGFDDPGYELNVDQIPLMHYSHVSSNNRPWLRVMSSQSQQNNSSLPYISTALSSFVDNVPMYQGSPSFSLPTSSLGPGDVRGLQDARGGGVMPHPPFRSRPSSAGSVRNRPSAGFPSAAVSRGGWVDERVGMQSVNGTAVSPEELEERLLRMGDELSRLASFEAECHRKDGVINSLRDEIADLKINRTNPAFRPGGEISAFSNTGIVAELRQQVSELQLRMKEKDDAHRTVTQKLADYQGQLHIKNEEMASLQKQLRNQGMQTPPFVDESNLQTNTLASLRTQMAEKDRKIAHLTHDLNKANKAKTQSATLMNTLQRENSAKDGMVQQYKAEVDKLKRQLREKDATISTLSAKLTRQKAIKEAEMEAEKREKDLVSSVGKLQTTERQLKERARQVSELQNELDRVKDILNEGRQSDRAIQQELDHAKAQFLDANRAEKLLKVDYQQLEKRFDRFRRKVIQNSFINNQRKLADRGELDDEELLDHIKDLSQEKVKLVDELRGYAEAEERQQNEKSDLKDAMGVLRKTLEGMERHLSRSGHGFKSLEKELTELEELHTPETLHWIKEVMCRLLSSEMSWQKRAEETLRRAGVDSDASDSEDAPTVEDLCRQLRSQRDKCRQLHAKITEMEEMHQDTILKLRDDAKREEERQVARAVAEVKTEQEEKRHHMMQEMRIKEQERVREAVETERRIVESQQGSVTQLQQVLSEKQVELESYRSALTQAKTQYEQAKEELQRTGQAENIMKVQVQEILTKHQMQVTRLEREKDEFKNYKQEEVASFKEQTRQHALTIVAMEERLLRLTKENKQLEQEVLYHKQQTGVRHRPSSPRKETSRPSSPKKITSPRPQSPKKEPKQTRSVETETSPQSSVEASLKSDVYKLEQLVLLLRRETSQAKMEAQGQSDVVQALRRDLAGASARMSDMTGELSDKQKQRLEEYEERITRQDQELGVQKGQLLKLSALVDEQQKEIDMREGELTVQQRSLVKQKHDSVKKGSELVKFQKKLVETIEDQEAKIEEIEHEKKTSSDLHAVGARCRGERHEMVIARQKEALAEFRQKAKVMEQLKPPLPSHEQSLMQIVALKKELSELRGSLAAREEDFHKSESQIHSELRVVREQSSSNLAEKDFEKSTHKDTKDALDLSEKTYLKLARTLGALLEVEPIPGCRSMAHIPAEERERLEQDREKAAELMVYRVKKLQERLDRKESLLGGYEDDLVNLRESQTVAGIKTAEATGLKIDVRSRQEEISYLRESLTRLRDELDQQRRLNVSLRERKKFAMDYEDRDTHQKGHSCHVDENTRYQEEAKKRKATDKMRRKNYEIESLKKELRSADRELNDTAIRLQAFESSRNLRSTQGEDMEYT